MFFYNQVLQDIHIKNFSKFMLLTIFKDNSNALAATNASWADSIFAPPTSVK